MLVSRGGRRAIIVPVDGCHMNYGDMASGTLCDSFISSVFSSTQRLDCLHNIGYYWADDESYDIVWSHI